MDNLNTQDMRLDRIQSNTFFDMLKYKLSNKQSLRFTEFKRVCGISQEQWDVFKSNNREAKLKWDF